MDQRLKERLFGAFILVSLFVIFLPMLFKQPAQETVLADKPKPEPRLEQPIGTLQPPAALNEWRQEVQRQVAQQQAASKGWNVQLGTFSDRENAQKLAQQLQAKGFRAYLEAVPGKSSHLTWVLVGPEKEINSAQALKEALNSQFKLEGRVVPYEPKA